MEEIHTKERRWPENGRPKKKKGSLGHIPVQFRVLLVFRIRDSDMKNHSSIQNIINRNFPKWSIAPCF